MGLLNAAEALPRAGRAWIEKPSVSLVAPAIPGAHPEWLHLTNLDRVVNPTFISVIFFYERVLLLDEGGYGEQFSIVTAFLKRSLAKVLVDFYPLAGRLTMEEKTGLIDLHCNDRGAVFREASTNLSLADIGGPQPMPILSGMECLKIFASASPNEGLIYVPDYSNPAVPVLVIQATRFACGSIAVAANWHHTVADAQSGCHFMRSWAEVATGQAIGVHPSFDRHLLQPRTPLDSSAMPPDFPYESSDSKAKPADQQQPLEAAVTCSHSCNEQHGPNGRCRQMSQSSGKLTNGNGLSAALAPEPLVNSFFISKESVQGLKDEVNDPSSLCHEMQLLSSSYHSSCNTSVKKFGFTSAVSVSALLWKLMAKARLEEEDDFRRREKSRFFMFVEGRKKLGLPAEYFGNVVCCACAESTHDELLKMPVQYSAALIKDAVSSIDERYLRSFIDWLENKRTAKSKDFKSKHLKSSGFDVAATFWMFFPLYDIDFGWGKPVLSVRNSPPRKLIDGVAMMPSPQGLGSMVALINLCHERMQTLKQDAEFQKFFQEKNAIPSLHSSSFSPRSQSKLCGYSNLRTNAVAHSLVSFGLISTLRTVLSNNFDPIPQNSN